ncbi:MAG: glycosyltransferase family 2 protein [Methylacidiphilales bacterium]|nr:glycosyltransferase family 2 protein [Candidatus Methylacidiphilales bacterium]MDW8348792.1 glycosyltransferase family 2 protein [Verrucomicrobiae bacterium]
MSHSDAIKITVCIITLNEEEALPRCLKSVQPFADEIVIVDSGSTDRTQKIAEEFGARFVYREWQGYCKQKNYAFELAQMGWIFSIDADEEVSEELCESILRLKRHGRRHPPSAFEVCRLPFYEGKWIRHGDWYPDWLPRLFQKYKAKVVGGRVHEKIRVFGRRERLNGHLYHYSYRDEADRRKRIEHYVSLWLESAVKRYRRKILPLEPELRALWRFIRGYIIRLGFLDGKLGWKIALGSAWETHLKYRQLRRLQCG